jgi:hypothetical protein
VSRRQTKPRMLSDRRIFLGQAGRVAMPLRMDALGRSAILVIAGEGP